MLTPTIPYRKELGDGLVLKSVAQEGDVERLAAFNGAVHEESVAALTRALILHHPHTHPQHWLYVEDETAGRVVSSLCLIPWTWRYEDVTLRAGEMGIVGTLEEYRHRGLVRAQAVRHAELLEEGGYDLSHIQGIPYFYRQFGYEYALPLEAWWRVELHLVADTPPDGPARYTFRQATGDDLPLLMEWYDRANGDLDVSTLRDEASWRYLLGPSQQTNMAAETWLVLEGGAGETARPAGYFRIAKQGFGEGLIVSEVSRLHGEATLAVLRQLKALAHERDKPYIRLNLPADSALVQMAGHLGAHDQGHYAWQIRLVDVGCLLRRLAPVLERRIAASAFAGLTTNLCFSLYRRAFELRFVGGRLQGVEALDFRGDGDIRMPPSLAAPLLLGYRSWTELARFYHDVFVRRERRYLVDVLFPRVTSFIYTVY